MANKYIIHGATYCGDGTASNEAASAGAAGAWNDINVLEGTAPAYGSLVAGDVVYIRSKTSAGADITRTLAANISLGSSAATSAAWITWVIDGGTIWSGINGTLTYQCPSNYSVTFRDYNQYLAYAQDKLYIKLTNTVSNSNRCVFNACVTDNLCVDLSGNTSNYGDYTTFNSSSEIVFRNPHFIISHYSAQYPLAEGGMSSKVTFINPTIELTVLPNQSEPNKAVFNVGQYGGKMTVLGGRVTGVGATSGAYLVSGQTQSGSMTIVGMQVPRAMALTQTPDYLGFTRVEAMGLDGGMGGAVADMWGSADSRQDGYYPTLSAFFPDSVNTPWSWKIYPSNSGRKNPFSLPASKLYTEAAATKTITAEVLIADSFTTHNKNTVWIEVVYTDATTGLPVSLSTRDLSAAALASSTAAWTLTYGGDNTKVSIPLVGLFSKKSLSIATPTSIKQNTPIYVTLFGTIKSASALDYLFFDPDFGVL